MTKLAFLALAVALLAGTGCERHPAAQTVPGFADAQSENLAAQNKEARTPIAISPDAPKFFPAKSDR